jgi:uncharacterized membrane protein
MDWIPTFGGNMLGWVPTWVLIAVVLLLLSVIVVLVVGLKTEIAENSQTENNERPIL